MPVGQRSKLLAACRSLPHVTEDVKWKTNLVFSVGDKMFAVMDPVGGDWVSFKATPLEFERLTKLPGVMPAPYAARYQWVLVTEDSTMPADARIALIEASYRLVFERLPKGKQAQLAGSARPITARAPRSVSHGPPPNRAARGRRSGQ